MIDLFRWIWLTTITTFSCIKHYNSILDINRPESPNIMKDITIYHTDRKINKTLNEKVYVQLQFGLFNGVVPQTERKCSDIQLCDKITSDKENF